METLHYQVRTIGTRNYFYANCDKSRLFEALIGKDSLSLDEIRLVKAIGFGVELSVYAPHRS